VSLVSSRYYVGIAVFDIEFGAGIESNGFLATVSG
jgi:hypothetical protein